MSINLNIFLGNCHRDWVQIKKILTKGGASNGQLPQTPHVRASCSSFATGITSIKDNYLQSFLFVYRTIPYPAYPYLWLSLIWYKTKMDIWHYFFFFRYSVCKLQLLMSVCKKHHVVPESSCLRRKRCPWRRNCLAFQSQELCKYCVNDMQWNIPIKNC